MNAQETVSQMSYYDKSAQDAKIFELEMRTIQLESEIGCLQSILRTYRLMFKIKCENYSIN